MSNGAVSPANQDRFIRQWLAEITITVHPLMAEAFFLAAIPLWYTGRLFAAMRQRTDGRNEGLIERLNQYSFIVPVPEAGERSYRVLERERDALNRAWIAQDPEAYRIAHRRAFAEYEAHPDFDPVVQAQLHLYHHFFVDLNGAVDELIGLFRTYTHDRRLAAIDRLLAIAAQAAEYLRLLDRDNDSGPLGDLLNYLYARQAQLRGQWNESLLFLEPLRAKPDLPPWLSPYVIRAYGRALAHSGHYVEAMQAYREALAQFASMQGSETANAPNPQTERALTLIDLGDAYVDLAVSARGHFEREAVQPGLWWHIQNAFAFFISLPLVAYLSVALGPRVWRRRFWPTLRNLDWVIARLFAGGARRYSQADRLLERHGTPAEGVLADEKLAFLFLRMGDAAQAHRLFTSLLAEEEAPIGEYRRALIQAGLGQALLWLGQPQAARPPLEAAQTTLNQYEDHAQATRAEALLADALAETGETDQALALYRSVLQRYQADGDRVRATEIVERLHALTRSKRLTPAQQATADQIARTLSERHYPVRFRSWITVLSQRAMLVLLTIVIFFVPLVTIRIDTSTSVEPTLSFRVPSPLRANSDNNQVAGDANDFPNPDFKPEVTPGVRALNLAQRPDPQFYAEVGFSLFLLYLLLTTLLGVWAILQASLAQVQRSIQTKIIHINDEGVHTGERAGEQAVRWADMVAFTEADVRFWDYPMIDNTATALSAPGRQVVLRGTTAWYTIVRDWLAAQLPPAVKRRNLSYSWLRSAPGFLYLITLFLFLVFVVLIARGQELLFVDWLGTPYSLIDLYPYFYLGLFLPPMWWFVIQPLRTRQYLAPESPIPWWVGGAGLAIFTLLAASGFRSWLTAPALFPALTALILVGSAASVITRVRRPGHPHWVYPWYLRGLALLAAGLIFVVLGSYLLREVRAYHQVVMGNSLRDQALKMEGAGSAGLMPEQETEVKELLASAAFHYDQTLAIMAQPLLGSRVQAATPAPEFRPIQLHQYIWYSALNNRAALALRMDQYDAAIRDYTALLDHPMVRQQPHYRAQLYSNRAIAYQRKGSVDCKETSAARCINVSLYRLAIADFDRAIEQAEKAEESGAAVRYHLWRGYVHHALGRSHKLLMAELARAQDDYRTGAPTIGEGCALSAAGELDAREQAKALIGRGWIFFANGRYQQQGRQLYYSDEYALAAELFQCALAQDANSADAYLALGYVHYARRRYDHARTAWERAAELAPHNAAVRIALGTLYWRLGTLGDDYNAGGTDRCQSSTLSEDEKQKAARTLARSIENYQLATTLPGQEREDIAYTFRTMGQVHWLLRHCPGYELTAQLRAALESYSSALELIPDNLSYNQMYGRLAYALWSVPPITSERNSLLYTALEHINKAYRGGLLDRYTLNFRAAILAGLLPVEQAELRAVLAAGNIDAAASRFDHMAVEGPEIAYGLLQTIEESLRQQAERRRIISDPEEEERYLALRTLLDTRKRQVPEWLFTAGAQALNDQQKDEGSRLYKEGLALAAEQGRIALVADELFRQLPLQTSAPASTTIAALIEQALPDLEQAAQRKPTFRDAAHYARLALGLQEFYAAGAWYNEALRRMAASSVCPNDEMNVVRDDLYRLWGLLPPRAMDLWNAMEVQLHKEQLPQHPELNSDALGYYWRCRAWVKYRMGLSAFRRGQPAAAYTILRSAWPDAEKAVQYKAARDRTELAYLREGAWGFYHMMRAADHAAAGDYAAALRDYAEGATLIQPEYARAAYEEKVDATFKAALMAARLGDKEQFLHYLDAGFALSDRYRERFDVKALLKRERDELAQLETLLAGDRRMALLVAEALARIDAALQ